MFTIGSEASRAFMPIAFYNKAPDAVWIDDELEPTTVGAFKQSDLNKIVEGRFDQWCASKGTKQVRTRWYGHILWMPNYYFQDLFPLPLHREEAYVRFNIYKTYKPKDLAPLPSFGICDPDTLAVELKQFADQQEGVIDAREMMDHHSIQCAKILPFLDRYITPDMKAKTLNNTHKFPPIQFKFLNRFDKPLLPCLKAPLCHQAFPLASLWF